MSPREVVVSAVLRTLLRATADRRTPVVLRSGRAAQGEALALWLGRAHGSPRNVVVSHTGPAEIEVRLPAKMVWPPTSAYNVRAPGSGALNRWNS